MCFSAIHWAKIPRCVYSGSPDDAASAGFDDRFLYDVLQGKTEETKCELVEQKHEDNERPFKLYAKAVAENQSRRY